MRITMVMVSTLNGKITRGSDPHIYNWTSREDQQHFFSLIAQAKLIVMGSKTYEVIRGKIQHKEGVLRVVLTRKPERYREDAIVDQLEFSSESPQELVSRLEAQGFTDMLLVGGGETNALFLEAKLVTELQQTIEPLLFGEGKSLIAEGKFDVKLQLLEFRQLNTTGTVLLRYSVINE